MDRSKMTGAAIMALAAFQMIAFSFGALRRSYVAVAVPVATALAGLSALAFWIGWTMVTTESDLEGPEFEEEFAATGGVGGSSS
ncbi:MAG TPA: hypothetical protein VNL92_03690 [Dehalococcoidia bacterium]|nr:hypothetical protein [Dehalococcoidia bacterium]